MKNLTIQGITSSQSLLYKGDTGMYSGSEKPIIEGVDGVEAYQLNAKEMWAYPVRIPVSDNLYKLMRPILNFEAKKHSESWMIRQLSSFQSDKPAPEMVMVANNGVCMLCLRDEVPESMQSTKEDRPPSE